MMTPKEVLAYQKAQPFRPFKIHMASGQTFEIRHPEMLRTGKTTVVVFSLVADSPELYDHWDTVSLMLIERLSHLDVPAEA